MITEMDITVLPRKNSGKGLNPYPDVLPDEVQEKLAKRYGELFSIFHKHADKIDRVNFWGVRDGPIIRFCLTANYSPSRPSMPSLKQHRVKIILIKKGNKNAQHIKIFSNDNPRIFPEYVADGRWRGWRAKSGGCAVQSKK
jgi:hypothetical protein